MQTALLENDTKKQTGRWSNEEHQRFMMAIAHYGKDWKKVEEIVGTRTGSQVRSHAQKFFNKLQKVQNKKEGKKKTERPQEHQSDSENSFIKGINEDVENSTPVELVSLIRKESQKDNSSKVNLKSLQKTLEKQMAVIQEQQENEQGVLNNLKRQNSFKSMNNILEAYENIKEPHKVTDFQDESFLIRLTKRYKKYFVQGGRFENLIDFGNSIEVAQVEQSLRKRSFTLPEGVNGDDEDLNERKKRVITDKQLIDFSYRERESFREAIEQHSKKQQQSNKNREMCSFHLIQGGNEN